MVRHHRLGGGGGIYAGSKMKSGSLYQISVNAKVNMMNNTLSHQGLKDQKENIKEKAMARKVNIAKFEKKKYTEQT